MDNNLRFYLKFYFKHYAAIAVLIPIVLALCTAIIKYSTYFYTLGRIGCYELPPSSIEIFSDGLFLEIFTASIVSMSIISSGYILYIALLMHFTLYCGAIFLCFFANFCMFYNKYHLLLIIFITAFPAILVFLLYRSRGPLNEEEDRKPITSEYIRLCAFLLFIFFAVYSFLTLYTGHNKSARQRTYSLISTDKVVVYDTSKKYYLCRCIVSDNREDLTILTSFQSEILRENVEIERITFQNVFIE